MGIDNARLKGGLNEDQAIDNDNIAIDCYLRIIGQLLICSIVPVYGSRLIICLLANIGNTGPAQER